MALLSVKDQNLPTHVTVHGRLAASLALWYSGQNEHHYHLWHEVWPTQNDFWETMPIFIPKGLQEFLPPAATQLLKKQRSKLEKDWQDLRSYIPSITKELYTYTWLIVNTRTFYWEYPDLPHVHPRLPKRRAKLTADDCYCMCPFIDYFNHSDAGCNPQHDAKGYSVNADREYKAGEEVFITYGSHTNDFLLAEYGFILENNKHDSIPLDHLLLPLLDLDQINALKDDGYHGDYTLSPPNLSTNPETELPICYRTQAVLRLLVLDSRRYSAFVSGDDDGSRDQARVNKYLADVLIKYSREIINILEELEQVDLEENSIIEANSEDYHDRAVGQRDVLRKRWRQIRQIVNEAIATLTA